MNTIKYYISGTLFVALCLFDTFLALMLVAVFSEGVSSIVVTLVILFLAVFATRKSYLWHKKNKLKNVRVLSIQEKFDESKETNSDDEPLWMSDSSGVASSENKIEVKQNQKMKGDDTVNNCKMTVTLSGDSGSDYKADIEIKNSILFIQCSCPAGVSSTRCKHAMSLINGDFSRLKDQSEKDSVSRLFGSFKIKPQDVAIKNELENIEKQEKELKERKRALKKTNG